MEIVHIGITGTSGFIGSHLAQTLRSYPHFIVHPIDRHGPPFEVQLKGLDIVIHLAALAHQKGYTYQDYYLSNTLLTQKLAHGALRAKVKHFIFISTVKIYGEGKANAYLKEDAENPKDDYAKSKLLAEKYLYALGQGHQKFHYTILRLPLVYGPMAKGNLAILHSFIHKLPLIPLGGIHNKRSMLYIHNFCALIVHLIGHYKDETINHKIYVPTDRNPVSTSELVRKMLQSNNYTRIMITIPYIIQKLLRKNKKSFYKIFGNLYINDNDLFYDLGFTPPFSLDNAFNDNGNLVP